MSLYNDLIEKKEKLSVIGLGYVGMPVAIAFARKVESIGFDISREKINLYKKGIDPTNEVGDQTIKETQLEFTADEKKLKEAKFHIVAVPTPVGVNHIPNLNPLKSACEILGRNLSRGSIIVFESTVYPGVTEEICLPILERESGLSAGDDFKVGYSPERINPGDKVHRLENIVKVVASQDEESLDILEKVYKLVVKAGIYKAENIKVAEAAKVIENAQRDINIAFMNELSLIFNKLGINTKSVLEAAGTKWNFMNFTPGLVGGHCIGVDPYYLTYIAEQVGYQSQIILSGRKINDNMGKYIADNIIKTMIKSNKAINGSNVAVLGITFKENTPDVRNTKVIDIINELKEFNVNVSVVDPIANKMDVLNQYGIELINIKDLESIDTIVFAVPHKEFQNLTVEDVKAIFNNKNHLSNGNHDENVVIDIKGIFKKEEIEKQSLVYWGL